MRSQFHILDNHTAHRRHSFRPQNAIEIRENGEIVVAFDDELTTAKLRSTSNVNGPEKDGFTFDRVFEMGSKQSDIFDFSIRPTVDDILNGYNGTVFAYGQTGAGKSYSAQFPQEIFLGDHD